MTKDAITAIYDSENPKFRLKYDFEGETVDIIVNNNQTTRAKIIINIIIGAKYIRKRKKSKPPDSEQVSG